ncbi:putative polyketide synthase [Xylariaceae sp. FL0016]|nr:putative polyketide synthase [Xylariaceae sp. FL0016]
MSLTTSASAQSEACTLEPIAICGMSCRLPGGVKSASDFWQMLVEKRTGQTPKVPASRFKIDAHYHESLERPGSFNVKGGYFLDGSPEDFDPTFFNMTPIEAQWLDPQQRKTLEACYECLVSAGIPLEKAAGSNTAVFVGCFTADHQQMSTREPDFRHNYAATGVDPGIISNRIGNVFNLHGPSFTINTACSSSIYAMHNACHALRARDCNAAIVAGVNLIVTVDQHMNTAKLGILSPTSTCHIFDKSADGYGRGEAAGAVYLKRLSDAIRDGDPIRGVIRSTAVNTNGKVPGMGITHPSSKGQKAVVRMAYEKAKLDPNLTAYAELHGTGTPVGDPIEVRAISRALNDTRPSGQPLLIGAVKPNIGHSEAASGVFAVMKAALMTESATIPGVALLNEVNPEILESDWGLKVNKDTAPWPSDGPTRRASVSSFGYGGTNGHVIVESIDSLYPWYRNARPKRIASYSHSVKSPVLIGLSAHDKTTLKKVISDVATVAPDYYPIDSAHTLNVHRTMFPHRAFVILREGQEPGAFNAAAAQSGFASTKGAAPEAAFLFTGQGVTQWLGMGKTAMREFPSFLDTIERLDRVLAKLRPAPSFRMTDILLDGSDESLINEACIAQPLCTAIQIALIDLFAQWNVEPVVSISHSSGEIAAAYSAGLIGGPEAIVVAVCRGAAVHQTASAGSMLAVGLGVDEVAKYMPDDPADVCVACENSPQSVTLSGRAASIEKLREELGARGIFARELKTGRAYHSPHMAAVGDTYDAMLLRALAVLSEDDLAWCRERSAMVFSVTGEVFGPDDLLPAGYWSANLRQRVRFDTAVRTMAASSTFSDVKIMLELGPHGALGGPFKQTCAGAALSQFTYIRSLLRNKDDTNQILSAAGNLFLAGYPIDLAEFNAAAYADVQVGSALKPRTQFLLVDLPPYPWNYERSYWAEPRASAEMRARAYPRHDLLGSRVPGLSAGSKVWRNILRHKDVAWLRDHSLGGSAIFPAAGYLLMAIEALRDVDIKAALVIPDNKEGIECHARLETTHDPEWYSFVVESLSEHKWKLNCQGRIRIAQPDRRAGLETARGRNPVQETALTNRVSAKTCYDGFNRVGFHYGPAFQQLQYASTDGSRHHAAGDVTVRDSSGVIHGESRSILHPATIDACLELILISIHAGNLKTMPWGVVPTRIEEITIMAPRTGNGEGIPATGHAIAWTDSLSSLHFNTHVEIDGSDGEMLMDIKSLTCAAFEAALPVGMKEAATPTPFSAAIWKPDIARLASTAHKGDRGLPDILAKPTLLDLLGLVLHRQVVNDVMVFGMPSEEDIDGILGALPVSAVVTIGHLQDKGHTLSKTATDCVTHLKLPSEQNSWEKECGNQRFDAVLVYEDATVSSSSSSEVEKGLRSLLRDEGWLLGVKGCLPFTTNRGNTGGLYTFQKSADTSLVNEHTSCGSITLLSLSVQNNTSEALAETLAATGYAVDTKPISAFLPGQDTQIVIDDTSGSFLSCLDKVTLESLQEVLTSGVPIMWLTKGMQQGRSMTGGMAAGLLRVVRSEQAASRIALLDYSENQTAADLGPVVVELLEGAATKESGRDTEFWLDNGILHVPRVYPNKRLNSELDMSTGISSLPLEPLPTGEVLEAHIVQEQFLLKQVTTDFALAPDEVDIQVLASEAQPMDFSETLVTGKIIRAGDSLVNTGVVGKRVIGFTAAGLRTVARSSLFATLEDATVVEQHPDVLLVSVLRPLMRVVNLTLHKANIQRGDSILALPGPILLMRLLAQLATELQWELAIAAISDDYKRLDLSAVVSDTVHALVTDDAGTLVEYLRKEDQSDSQVILLANKLDTLSQEVWRGIPAAGQFILLGNEETPSAPDPLPFARGASFTSANGKFKPSRRLLESTLNLVKAHPQLLRDDFKEHVDEKDISDLPGSANSGNSVDGLRNIVKFSPNNSAVKARGYLKVLIPETETMTNITFQISRSLDAPRLSGDATYLLIGCLGGLGRSLARRMVELGARHFAFISRTGADKPEAALVIRSVEESGASARVFRADASVEEAVRKVAVEVNAEYPIRGVIHAAMVLQDGMFEQMKYDAFMTAVIPKARGAVALQNAMQGIQGLDLDFFIMTSSISALLGNTGQSNYSAANSVLDSLARFRRANGTPATSLELPMVLDVGVVAESDGLEASLARKGLYGIDESEMLRGFEVAMTHSRDLSISEAPVLVGFDLQELAAAIANTPGERLDLYWINDPRFCHAKAAIEASQKGGSTGNSGNSSSFKEILDTTLREKGYQDALECIAWHIAKRLSIISMIPIENMELQSLSIASYGLDSMIGAEMRTWIFRGFGLDYPFQKLLAPTLTLAGLAAEVASTMEIEPNVD